ncbi:hypothetical protein PFISCL1PPCAC_18887, partial [Pristionchus fissidentatus]
SSLVQSGHSALLSTRVLDKPSVMCKFIINIIYGAIVFIAFCLTVTSVARDTWFISGSGMKATSGVLPCADTIPTGDELAAGKICTPDWNKFKDLSFKMQAIVGCLIFAAVMEVVCFVFNILSAFSCCCKQQLGKILSSLSSIVTIFLLIPVVIVALSNSDNVEKLKKQGWPISVDDVGHGDSFICATVALVFSIINIILAVVAQCCISKK